MAPLAFEKASNACYQISSTGFDDVNRRLRKQLAALAVAQSTMPGRCCSPGSMRSFRKVCPPYGGETRVIVFLGIRVQSSRLKPLERDRRLPGVRSNRVAGIFWVEDYTAPNLVPALLEVRQALAAHRQVVLMPINDRQVGVIAQALPTVAAQHLVSWEHCAQTVVRLQRKDELEAVCVQKSMRYPRSIVFQNPQQARLATEMRFPLIIKPVRPLSSFKTLMAQDLAELEGHLLARASDLPILCQEYVAGDDRQIYFGALMLDHGRVLHRMAGRKIVSHPPARGQTTIAETVDAPEVLQLTELFFAGLELTGPVSLELKRDPEGEYWVIEPTLGRTDFWAELCISAGFNQPLMEYQLAAGLAVTPATGLRECVWYDTEREPAAYLSLCRYEGSLRPLGKDPVFPYLGHADHKTFLQAVARMAQRKVRPVAAKPGTTVVEELGPTARSARGFGRTEAE